MSVEEIDPSIESSKGYEIELSVPRGIINEVDLQIVELLNRRINAALEVGRIKNRYGLPIYVSSREKEVIERVCEANENENGNSVMQREDLAMIFESIMKASRSAQQRLMDGEIT